jgi:hypothetical protein
MADEDKGSAKSGAVHEHLKARISSAFPKLAGAKLDKTLATDEIK